VDSKVYQGSATGCKVYHFDLGNEEEGEWNVPCEIERERVLRQVEGLHFDAANISAPVTNEMMSMRIVMVLALMTVWTAQIIDVKGAFLHGDFDENYEKVYLRPPKGFQRIYEATW